jgi:hypothetical protein
MTLKRYIPGAVLLMLVWTITISAQNLTEQENALEGSRAWRIPASKAATARQIEGYASENSINVGEPIKFFVNVTDGSPTFRIEIFRLGYYQGAGGRLIDTILNLPSAAQPLPDADPLTGLADCNWTMSYEWTAPGNVRHTGVYVAKLTASSGKQSYIPFVIRADDRQSPYLFQASVTTWQAYNFWPADQGATSLKSGKSLYLGQGPNNWLSFGPPIPYVIPANPNAEVQARKVSFNRPYLPDNGIYQTAGQFFIRGEYNMVRWLEKEGYDVAYTTNVDIDAATDMINGPLGPGKHKVFLSVGHDEYWTWQMRDNIEKARNRTTDPLNLGFFGGNAVHWQIRFENSSQGAAKRTIVAYKHLARRVTEGVNDPYYVNGGSPTNYLTTNYWRENDTVHLGNQCPPPFPFQDCFKPPEDELVGVMLDLFNVTGNGSFKFYAGGPDLPPPVTWHTAGITDLVTPIQDIIGYEADRVFDNVYSNRGPVVKLGDSVFNSPNRSHAVYYRITNAGRVFGAGTIGWSYGLDQFGRDPDLGPVYVDHTAPPDARLDILTRNILKCLSDGVGCN